jgi:GntR family transcriptional regulator, phosphonate transport system regulatory protein
MRDKAMTKADASASVLRGEGVSAWRQIVDGLEADLASGRLGPGDRLPTEAQLAERFGVNRHTVRRAIAVLAARGLVRSTQGLGSFVEAKPLTYSIGGRARFTENVTSAGREATSELLSSRIATVSPHVAEALALEAGAPVLELRTLRRADGAPLAVGTAYLPLPRFRGFDKHFKKSGSMTRALRACGVADYRRMQTRISARTAGVEEASLLQIAPGRTLLVTEGINVDAAGARIQLMQSVFPADRVELIVKSEDD